LHDDRIPIPLQALLPTFVAAMVAAPTHLAWFLLRSFAATRSWSWLAPLVGLAIAVPVLRRAIERGAVAGMVDPQRSPLLTAVLTTIGAATIWLGPLLPSFTGPRTASNRHAVGLDVAVPALATWVGACLALWIDRRRREQASSSGEPPPPQ
jgi:hypothetical protein